MEKGKFDREKLDRDQVQESKFYGDSVRFFFDVDNKLDADKFD